MDIALLTALAEQGNGFIVYKKMDDDVGEPLSAIIRKKADGSHDFTVIQGGVDEDYRLMVGLDILVDELGVDQLSASLMELAASKGIDVSAKLAERLSANDPEETPDPEVDA